MRRVLGPSVTADRALVLAQQHHRMRFELRLGRLRGMRSRGWRPKIELQGARFLREALAQGRGVILWRMLFCSNPVVMQALERNGTPLVHLSNVYHGAPSRSRLGIRFVSPLYCRPENDYLAKRVIIPLDGSLGYMRTLLDSLRQNACVSVVGEHRGRQNVSVSFFGSQIELAAGAPSLVWKSGAVLLTAYALRLGPYHYRVVIDEPVAVDRRLAKKAFVAAALGEFTRRLESHVREHPADWQGWLRRTLRLIY